MKPSREERLRRLLERREARKRRAPPEPVIVYSLPGELPHETSERLHAAGRTSAALVLPAPVDLETWAASCRKYQAWLADHGARIASGASEPSTGDLIARAYRASLDPDAPMPTL